MRRLFNPRFFIFPSLIFFGVLTLGLRIDAVWQTAVTGKALSGNMAYAESKEGGHSAEKPAEGAKETVKEATKPVDDISVPSMPAPEVDAEDTSPAEMEVLKQLSSRRAALDKRAQTLDTREVLIKVGEQRVDQKIKEMETLRLQLQGMVDQISGNQQTQISNLVKIYETMKPQEAAKIFEALEMPILLGVIQRMKPKSTAPIMAAMAPEKAKEITVALTKEGQLPQGK
jgi:flagellar motility protein MotE (MotC chaperone)